jgi:glutamine transport system permease protein
MGKQRDRRQALINILSLGSFLVVCLACSLIAFTLLDLSQNNGKGSILDPGVIFPHVGHFLSDLRASALLHNTAFFQGVGATIEATFIAMPLALALGLGLALMVRSGTRWLAVPARAYIEFFRNTPILVQMYAIYYGLAFSATDLVGQNFLGTLLSPFLPINVLTAVLATLTLNYAAYEAENFRGGFEALDKGQGEAAVSLGLSSWQSLWAIILPQSIRIIIPTVINDFIYMFKDSAILSLITFVELTATADRFAKRFPKDFWQYYVLAALLYLVLSIPLAAIARAAERALRAEGQNRRSSTLFVPLAVFITTLLLVGLLFFESAVYDIILVLVELALLGTFLALYLRARRRRQNGAQIQPRRSGGDISTPVYLFLGALLVLGVLIGAALPGFTPGGTPVPALTLVGLGNSFLLLLLSVTMLLLMTLLLLVILWVVAYLPNTLYRLTLGRGKVGLAGLKAY